MTLYLSRAARPLTPFFCAWIALIAELAIQSVSAGQSYYPFDFGIHDGNNWQVWRMNGSNIYPRIITEYVGGYLHERWPLQTYAGGFYCSSCAQHNVFSGNPVINGNPVQMGGAPLKMPQNFAGDATRYIDIQWSPTGYHWKIITDTGELYSTYVPTDGDATCAVDRNTYDSFSEDHYGYGAGVERLWQASIYASGGLGGGNGIATTPLKIMQGVPGEAVVAIGSFPAPNITLPTTAPSASSMPLPAQLSSQFSSYYTTNRNSFDATTQSYFDSPQQTKIVNWLSDPGVKRGFIAAADGYEIFADTMSLGSLIIDFQSLTGILKNGSAGASDAYAVLSDGYNIASQAKKTKPSIDSVVAYVDAGVALIGLGAAAIGAAPEIVAVGALMGLNGFIWGQWVSPQLRKFGEDPADTNYKAVVVPERILFGKMPPTADAHFDDLAKAAIQSASDVGSYIRAANQTLDKYAGALNARDGIYATLQVQAFLAFMTSYDQSSQQAARDAKALSDYLKNVGMVASAQNSDMLLAVQKQLRASGFSPAVVGYFTALGLSASDIEQRRQIILTTKIPSVPVDLSFTVQGIAAAMNQATSVSDSKLINLSVRTAAGSGDSTLIAGFVVSGSAQKSLLIRAIGPTLSAYGVSGVLKNPRLDIYSGASLFQSNSSWPLTLASKFSALGAFTLPTGSKDAALVASIGAGAYTAQVLAGDGASGIALVEIYDDSTVNSTSRLVNISARTQVGTGANILIAGFVVGGNSSRQLLIRAVGPTLSGFGVGGTLTDPKLQIFQGATLIAQNDDWSQEANAVAVQVAAQRVGAFELPSSSKDSALLVTLPPGNYTAQVSGVAGLTGVALVEIYDVP